MGIRIGVGMLRLRVEDLFALLNFPLSMTEQCAGLVSSRFYRSQFVSDLLFFHFRAGYENY